MRKTKIVCTLGPSTDDEAVLRELILSGMNVARLNMSHGTHEEQKRRADMVKKLRKELDVPVAILLDTKGPEIRTGKFAEKVMLTHGQKYTLTTNERPGDAEGCSITFKDLPKDVHRGSHILIDDGLIEMVVEKVTDTDIECRLLNDGPITSYQQGFHVRNFQGQFVQLALLGGKLLLLLGKDIVLLFEILPVAVFCFFLQFQTVPLGNLKQYFPTGGIESDLAIVAAAEGLVRVGQPEA